MTSKKCIILDGCKKYRFNFTVYFRGKRKRKKFVYINTKVEIFNEFSLN